jgi:hypothetical protein
MRLRFEVKRLVTVVTLAVVLVGIVLFGSNDKDISVADTSVPSNETTINQTQTSNSSASAGITITMYTGDESDR